MNRKVFIKQDGTIPGHRIIEELERRGGGKNVFYTGESKGCYYYIDNKLINLLDSYDKKPPFEDYTELLYNKEDDSFYEKTECSDCVNDKGCINRQRWQIPVPEIEDVVERGFDAQIPIPKEYEAKIEDNKVIVRKKKWKPKEGEAFYYVRQIECLYFEVRSAINYDYSNLWGYLMPKGNCFQKEEEAQVFCDKLNAAIKPIFDERIKELE